MNYKVNQIHFQNVCVHPYYGTSAILSVNDLNFLMSRIYGAITAFVTLYARKSGEEFQRKMQQTARNLFLFPN